MHKNIVKCINNFISPFQHGFMPKRSTVTNLACFSQFVSEVLDSQGQVDVIFTDFRKAFDRIDHYILLAKLEGFGCTPALIQLIKSYLIGRENRVRYANFVSNPFWPNSGVPQGSNLGPLLFLLFINDLPDSLNCYKLLFADDLKLFTNISSSDNCLILQNDLNSLTTWCDLNRLDLNIPKCNVLSFTRRHNILLYQYQINNEVLNRINKFKDLGVVFDQKFTFNDHILDIIAKSYNSYGFIYRNCKEFTNLRTLQLLYCSLIRTRLEYAALIWFPIYRCYIDQLEYVQRKFLKFLSFLTDGFYPPRGSDHQILLSRFNFASLETRRTCIIVAFLYNLVNHNLDCSWLLEKINYAVPRVSSRQNLTFSYFTGRSNVFLRSPIVLMCRHFNFICSSCDIHYNSKSFILNQIVKYVNS